MVFCFLGNRVNVEAIEIRNDRIIITMMTQGSNNFMCCSTLEVSYRFAVKENKLISVAESSSTNNKPEIIGILWKWEQAGYNNETTTIPAEPDQYMLKLQPDGTAEVRADCNRGIGTYAKEGCCVYDQVWGGLGYTVDLDLYDRKIIKVYILK